MNCIIDVEPLVACLRVFKKGTIPGVDPYDLAATLVYSNDGKTVELKGVTSNGQASFQKFRLLLFQYLNDNGVKFMKWERRKNNGTKKIVIIDTKTFKLVK